MNPEKLLIADIRDRANTRDDIAVMYAEYLNRDHWDWSVINGAIVERWSMSGLRYVKDKAWRLAEARKGVRDA